MTFLPISLVSGSVEASWIFLATSTFGLLQYSMSCGLWKTLYARESNQVKKVSHILALYENGFTSLIPKKSLRHSPGCPGPHFDNYLKHVHSSTWDVGDGVMERGA